MALSAELELPVLVVHPGERLVYRVVNTGTEAITFGEMYRLEQATRSGWAEVPTGPFRAIGYVLQPGARKELTARITLGEPLGRHRLLADVREDYPRAPGSRPLTLEAEFDVFAAD